MCTSLIIKQLILKASKKKKEPDLFEFKFSYIQAGEAELCHKHFFAEDLTKASEMFTFACTKSDLKIDSMKVTVWNRWADRWDDA